MNDLSATERCVKCGLCLPHCPTFQLTGNEADSPRGRISLMQMLDEQPDDLSPALFRHLDQCLLCRACEAMCPSDVPFERLMDAARERLEQRRHRPPVRRLIRAAALGALTSRRARPVMARLLRATRAVGIHRLVRMPGVPAGARRLLELLPADIGRNGRNRERNAAPVPLGRIDLFTGCTGELLDHATLDATRYLLEKLGYEVAIPAGQTCCGALHQHSGASREAVAFAERNLAAFADNDTPVIAFASGCCAQLLNYRHLNRGGTSFAARVTDVMTFVADRHLHTLPLKRLEETVALHLPCTQRNVLGRDAVMRVLGRIPGLEVTLVNPDGGCCGAAGAYMLYQPEVSDRLGDAMVERVMASGARTLLTTNIGCSLQLAAGIRRRGRELRVLHPASLLASLLD